MQSIVQAAKTRNEGNRKCRQSSAKEISLKAALGGSNQGE
jgi:hypothetical protein